MGYIKSLNKWANAHTYYPLDLLRIALGIFLFYKGVYFMSNLNLLIDLIEPVKSVAGDMLIVHYIAPAHFVGGFLIGFGTRWAGGCTSGHAISGLANLQLPSLVAVIGFVWFVTCAYC